MLVATEPQTEEVVVAAAVMVAAQAVQAAQVLSLSKSPTLIPHLSQVV
jgi:hypothetical protein